MNTVLSLPDKILFLDIRNRHNWIINHAICCLKISRLARWRGDLVSIASKTKMRPLQKRRDFSETTNVGRVIETTEPTAGYVSVADFYAGKSVFMTGVTGFLGKVFPEKLLYSCKDIDNVYVLNRDKKGKNAKQRIEEVFNKPIGSSETTAVGKVMETTKQSSAYVSVADFYAGRSIFMTGVTGFLGKVFLEKLLYSCVDIDNVYVLIREKKGKNAKQRLEEEVINKPVSVVFHVAAAVRFDEGLKVTVNTNVRGTKYVLHLCQRMKNIKSFVHISTAYCNIDKPVLKEKVYPPPVKLSEVQKLLEQSNHDREQIKALLNGLPNTYSFAKALAETYVAENYGNIPTVIIRPAIVSGSLREPLAGWVDNWLGATGILAAIMKGGIRVMLGNGDNVLDLIPVDYVTNLTIVAAARCCSSDNVAVYNSCTSSCNPLTLRNISKYLNRAVSKSEFDGSRVTVIFTENKCILSTLTFLLQTTPAYLADLFLRATGKKPIYMKIQSKVTAGRDMLEFFTSNSLEMQADHTRALHASMSVEDRHQFPCDPADINWDEYMSVYIKGIKRFLMPKRV